MTRAVESNVQVDVISIFDPPASRLSCGKSRVTCFSLKPSRAELEACKSSFTMRASSIKRPLV
jgi:hypothetical protein